MLTSYDKIVIAFYFIFMTLMSWLMKRFVRNTSDYFRGGGEMLWWMAGAGAFVGSFSAVTFTGMAGKAYLDGPIVMVIFVGNALGFFINYLWFAPVARQTRAVTAMQVVRARFGKASEQFFTWISIPVQILYAGLWLSGLGVFVSAAFGRTEAETVIITGSVVVVMALLGGSWSVMAGDFVQMLVLMPISIITAILALNHVGGTSAFFQKLPPQFYHWGQSGSTSIIVLWCFATLVQKFVSTNSMSDSNRYLSVKDSSHARKAALLGAILYTIGPVLWFIPPMAARIAYPHLSDMHALFPNSKNPQEAAYFVIAKSAMPVGMIGLLLSAIFGACMSAMDGGLNKSAGFFVKNFYQVYVNPTCSERGLLVAGKLTTLCLGFLIILAGLKFSSWKGTNIFEQMTYYSGLVGLPVAIPLVLGLFIKRAPGWAAWSTVLVTFAASLVTNRWMNADWAARAFGMTLSAHNISDWGFLSGTLVNTAIGCAWFVGVAMFAPLRIVEPRMAQQALVAQPTAAAATSSTLDYETPIASEDESQRVSEFFTMLKTPVDFSKEEGAGSDNMQLRVMGLLCMIYGGFILLLMLIPNSLTGRLAFLFCGGTMGGIGLALHMLSKSHAKQPQRKIDEPSDPAPIIAKQPAGEAWMK